MISPIGRARRARNRRSSGKIIERRGCPARGARGRRSTRQAAVVEAQAPALAAGKIDEGKAASRRPRQPVARADACRDRRAPRDCPTAADGCRCRSSCRARRRDRSGSARRLGRSPRGRRLRAAPRQPHGGSKPGEAGADDMDGPRHQKMRGAGRSRGIASAADAPRCARRLPAARDQARRGWGDRPPPMMRGARTARRGLAPSSRRPRRNASARAATDGAGLVEAGSGQHGRRLVAGDAGLRQRLARQIEPADGGVLVEVAQDVGELQRAAEMMREPPCRRRSMPKTRTESRPTALATRSQ